MLDPKLPLNGGPTDFAKIFLANSEKNSRYARVRRENSVMSGQRGMGARGGWIVIAVIVGIVWGASLFASGTQTVSTSPPTTQGSPSGAVQPLMAQPAPVASPRPLPAVTEPSNAVDDRPEVSSDGTDQDEAADRHRSHRHHSVGGGCASEEYRSTDGSCVHRPYHTNRHVAGETAVCRDGTHSMSHHHRGTCSHHGGVASWD